MSDKVYLRNISGQNYLIPEIYSKPIGADTNRIWEVDKSIVDNSMLLQNLINQKKFVFCNSDYQAPASSQNNEKKDVGITRDVKYKKEENIVDKHIRGFDLKKESRIIKNESSKTEIKEESIDPVFSFGDIGDIVNIKSNDDEKILKTENQIIKKSEKIKNDVWWRGPANDMGGYGKMNRYCLEGLAKKDDLNIHLDMHNIPSIRNTIPLSKELEEMLENKVGNNAHSVWAIMPPKFPTRQGKIIYFTMLESAGVHPSFVEKLNNADEIWVPCLFNMDVLKKEKISAELKHIQLGVDTDLYKPIEISAIQKKKFNIQTKGFVFLSVFGWSLRKGTDVLLKSYLKTFSKLDDVTLLIVSRLNGSSSVENIKRIRDEISEYIRTFCPNPANHPHIVHIGVGIAEKEMPILYNMCDCFVLPSRGEGWCLPAIEAGACGVPVIMTRCSGQLDFLNDENSYLVDIEGYGMEKQEIKDISSYYEDVPFAVLGNKAIEQTSEYMKHAYVNRRESREKGKILMNNIRENFTWQKTVDKIYERLTS
jgi:glycosyltransferase involved in cell wall biosynthesis